MFWKKTKSERKEEQIEEQIECPKKERHLEERHLEIESKHAFFNEALLTYFSKKKLNKNRKPNE